MYKKLYSLFIIISLCLYAICPVSAKGDVILKASDAEGFVGSEINVTVSIENCRNVYAGSFNICYDSSMLEVVDCVKGEVFGGIVPGIKTDYAVGKVRVNWSTPTTSIDDGELFCLTFRAKNVGTSEISFEKVKFSDLNFTALSYTLTSATVTAYEASGEPQAGAFTVISSDNSTLKISGDEYEYTAVGADKLYVADYNESGRTNNVSETSGNSASFSKNGILSDTRFFAWDNNMKPVRKAVSVSKSGIVSGFVNNGTNVACAEAVNKSSESEDFTLYVAQYNQKGTLIKLDSGAQTVNAGKTEILNVQFVPASSCVSFKIYMCDSEMELLGEEITLGR